MRKTERTITVSQSDKCAVITFCRKDFKNSKVNQTNNHTPNLRKTGKLFQFEIDCKITEVTTNSLTKIINKCNIRTKYLRASSQRTPPGFTQSTE